MCQVSPHDKVRHWSTYLGIGRISLKTILFLTSKHSSKEKKNGLMLKRLEKKECPLDSVTLCEDSFLLELKSNKRGYKEISRKIDQNPWFLGIQ